MNQRPIETALDADLRLSVGAMQRAAHRARLLALQTGTSMVISRQGVIEFIEPQIAPTLPPAVHEPTAPYGKRR